MLTLRPVLSLILAVWFLQLSGGILSVVTPVGLKELGASSLDIGGIAALHAAGFMAGAYYAPKIIGDFGNIRVFAAAAALTAVGALSQGLWMSDIGWALIRFVQGATFAAMFASAESWLGRVTPKEQRGGVLGAYNVAAKAALLFGPLIVLSMSPLDPRNFIWCGLFLAAALVPVCITRRQEPPRVKTASFTIARFLRTSPSAFCGVFIAGLVNTGTLSLLPIYAVNAYPDANALAVAGIAYTVANIGGLISQWPAGLISDRIDRRNVVAFLSILGFGASLSLFIIGSGASITLTYALIFLWGAGSLSFYGVCVAHGADRVEDADMTSMMSMLLITWAFGSVLGPIAAGLIMQTTLGPSGLFAFSATCLLILTLIMFVRRIDREPVPDKEQSSWQPAMPAGMPGGDLDPRT
jgi:MFS family permease